MKKLIFTFFLTLILLIFPATAFADFGGYSGTTDFSTTDFGGSSSTFDYGDYDDYGSGYSSYGYVSTGSSSASFSDWIFAAVAVAFIVGFYLLRSRSKKSGSGKSVVIQGQARNLREMSEYYTLDENFNEAEFKETLSNLYVQMQNCWTDGDIEPVRPYFTDAFYTQMERQLEQLKRAGQTNYVERIAVLGVNLQGFEQRGGEDIIVARLNTRIVDYTLDSAGELVSGSKTSEKFMTYEWDLSRQTGSTTQKDSDKVTRISCPSCGAPVDINASARCEYCGSVLINDKHDWALCAIKGISQQTR